MKKIICLLLTLVLFASCFIAAAESQIKPEVINTIVEDLGGGLILTKELSMNNSPQRGFGSIVTVTVTHSYSYNGNNAGYVTATAQFSYNPYVNTIITNGTYNYVQSIHPITFSNFSPSTRSGNTDYGKYTLNYNRTNWIGGTITRSIWIKCDANGFTTDSGNINF